MEIILRFQWLGEEYFHGFERIFSGLFKGYQLNVWTKDGFKKANHSDFLVYYDNGEWDIIC